MNREEYERVLLAITYVESFLSKDQVQRELVFDSVTKQEIASGLTTLLMTVMSYAVISSPNGLSVQDILEIARRVAIDKVVGDK